MPCWLFEALPSLHKEVIQPPLEARSVAGLLRLYGVSTRGWVYQCPQHILGFVLRCVHNAKILCQTAVYFGKVLVFQERTIGNSPLNWTETLVLHFIGG